MVRFRDYAPSDIVVALEGMEAHAAAAREYKQASAISEAAREIARARAALQELVSQEAEQAAARDYATARSTAEASDAASEQLRAAEERACAMFGLKLPGARSSHPLLLVPAVTTEPAPMLAAPAAQPEKTEAPVVSEASAAAAVAEQPVAAVQPTCAPDEADAEAKQQVVPGCFPPLIIKCGALGQLRKRVCGARPYQRL